MPKVLLIDESELLRNYLKSRLTACGLEVQTTLNGFEAMARLRSNPPDLVLLDFNPSRAGTLEFLKELRQFPDTAEVPVIVLSPKLERQRLLEIARYGIRRFFAKPVRIDALMEGISQILGIPLGVDDTPCILEAHFNEEILFIEVAQGLNAEKIDLLRYKIRELLQLYEMQFPKVLMILTDLPLAGEDRERLQALFTAVREATRSPWKAIKVLTTSVFVRKFLRAHNDFHQIEVLENLTQAMDRLLGLKVSQFIQEGHEVVRSDFLRPTPHGKEESLHLRYTEDARVGQAVAVVAGGEAAGEPVRAALAAEGYRVRVFESGAALLDGPGGGGLRPAFPRPRPARGGRLPAAGEAAGGAARPAGDRHVGDLGQGDGAAGPPFRGAQLPDQAAHPAGGGAQGRGGPGAQLLRPAGRRPRSAASRRRPKKPLPGGRKGLDPRCRAGFSSPAAGRGCAATSGTGGRR